VRQAGLVGPQRIRFGREVRVRQTEAQNLEESFEAQEKGWKKVSTSSRLPARSMDSHDLLLPLGNQTKPTEALSLGIVRKEDGAGVRRFEWPDTHESHRQARKF
jgi:hypothetical protein